MISNILDNNFSELCIKEFSILNTVQKILGIAIKEPCRATRSEKNQKYLDRAFSNIRDYIGKIQYNKTSTNDKYHKLYKNMLVFTEILTKMEHGNTTGEYFMEKTRFEKQIPIPRLLKIIENLENNGFLKVNDAGMAGNNERVSDPLEKPRLSVGERNFEGYLQKFKQWFESHNTIYDDKQSDKALAKINSRLERKLEIDKMGDRKSFMISEFPEYS